MNSPTPKTALRRRNCASFTEGTDERNAASECSRPQDRGLKGVPLRPAGLLRRAGGLHCAKALTPL
jgi:hypothetical protein